MENIHIDSSHLQMEKLRSEEKGNCPTFPGSNSEFEAEQEESRKKPCPETGSPTGAWQHMVSSSC